MKRASLALAAAWLLSSANGHACSCGVPGLDGPLTSPIDSWGARISESATFAMGRANAHGDYRVFTAGEFDRRVGVSALVAFRPWSRLELSVAFDYLRESAREARSTWSLAGPGDTVARARFEWLDETPSYAPGVPLPALALTAAIRAPTAVANSATSLGLGTWEAAVGVALERSVSPRVRLGLAAEGALRGSDDSIGRSRRLGPRVSSQLTGWYWPVPQVACSLSSSLIWEGEASLGGAPQPGSGSRQLQASAGLVYRPPASSLRSGVAARYIAPLPGMTVNATASTTLELFLAYVH